MIYWTLYWTFFKVGLFTIGGGYAMIPLIQEAVINEHGWMTPDQFTEFVGIAESTPGPFAINISTFAGVYAAQGTEASSLLGSLCATAGVITPSIIIILLIAALSRHVMKHWAVRSALRGAKPVVVGLIGAAFALLYTRTLFPEGAINVRGLILGAILLALLRWKNLSALALIGISALGGLIIFGLFA